jgi:hypothetical protein
MERIGKLSDDKDKLLAILESLKEAGTSPPTGDGRSEQSSRTKKGPRFDPPFWENICLVFQLSHGCPLFRPPSLLV